MSGRLTAPQGGAGAAAEEIFNPEIAPLPLLTIETLRSKGLIQPLLNDTPLPTIPFQHEFSSLSFTEFLLETDDKTLFRSISDEAFFTQYDEIQKNFLRNPSHYTSIKEEFLKLMTLIADIYIEENRTDLMTKDIKQLARDLPRWELFDISIDAKIYSKYEFLEKFQKSEDSKTDDEEKKSFQIIQLLISKMKKKGAERLTIYKTLSLLHQGTLIMKCGDYGVSSIPPSEFKITLGSNIKTKIYIEPDSVFIHRNMAIAKISAPPNPDDDEIPELFCVGTLDVTIQIPFQGEIMINRKLDVLPYYFDHQNKCFRESREISQPSSPSFFKQIKKIFWKPN
ncbi:MAG: hypothetical protein ACOYK9_04770 [Chlamydiia bacterium]